MKKHGLLAFYKTNKKKTNPNNSLEIKSPKVPENVNSEKCGGCKNHKLSFTFVYSIYVCSEQCSMVRAGNPVSAASHCGHASHSRGWAGATPSHRCPFPWMSWAKPLSVLSSTREEFCFLFAKPYPAGWKWSWLQELGVHLEAVGEAVPDQVIGYGATFCSAEIWGELWKALRLSRSSQGLRLAH